MPGADTPAVVAVDVGSTSARAGVFDTNGVCLGRAAAPFETNRPAPHHAEHDSAQIWTAVCTAVQDARRISGVAAQAVRGLAFDATCSLVLLDRDGAPLSVSETGEDRWNVLMWADHRAEAEAAEITATAHRALRHVGGVMSPEMQLPKLLWLKRHRPASWARTALALDLTDFLAWRATGIVAVSACTVTCKWAYLEHEAEPARSAWPDDLLAAIGLDDFHARTGAPPRATPVAAPIGRLTEATAASLGLTPACIVGAGLIDAHAGGLGLLGGHDPASLDRRLAMIAGTSTCHMAVAPQPRFIPGIWGPYPGAMLPGLWLNEGGQSATGALLDHILDWHAAAHGLGPDRHARVAARIAELLDAEGPAMVGALAVLPDFNGNRSPLADPNRRGVIAGLTLDTSFDSLARLYYAAAIGIALGTRHILEALNARGYAIDTLHLAGGHTANPVLLRLYADATSCRLVLPEGDGILTGTACVAATAANLHPTLTASARAMSNPTRTLHPDPANRARFDTAYTRFLRLHDIAAMTGPATTI